jgi:hypothetical protein
MWLYTPEQLSVSSQASAPSTSLSDACFQTLSACCSWRGKRTPVASWRRAWKTAPWLQRLSGAMSRHSQQSISEAVSIWWREAFPARTSALPETALASRENGPASSSPSRASFATYDPATCSWRTSQHSLFEDSTPFSGRWPTSGSMRSGAVYERPTLARHMAAIGGGASPGTASCWPTPVANDDNKSLEAHLAMKQRMPGGPRSTVTSLQVFAKAWPTPYGFNGQDKDGGYGTGGEFEKYVKNWPTPATRDYRSPNSAESQMRRGRTDETGQQLSNFVAHHWQATRAPWEPCPCCENFLCTIHEMHAHDCDCPSIEEWETDPYFRPDPLTATAGAPTSNATPTSRLQLNPRFVEALMGLAPGWTGFEDWATPWCPSRPKRLSGCSGIAHLDNGRE